MRRAVRIPLRTLFVDVFYWGNNDVLVIVDHVNDMPAGQPPLLKTSRSMRYEDAVALWKELQRCGWTVAKAAW